MMRKIFGILIIAGLLFSISSCERRERAIPVSIGVQLQFEGAPFDIEGISVILSDATGIVDYEAVTNSSGYVEFCVPAGAYSATSVYKYTQDGERIAFNGTNSGIVVGGGTDHFVIDLLKVVSQQVIIKELYNGGCLSADGLGAYQSDQ